MHPTANASTEDLYAFWRRVTTPYLRARVRDDWEDASHDGFLVFLAAMRVGKVETPEGYALGIAMHVYHGLASKWSRRRAVALTDVGLRTIGTAGASPEELVLVAEKHRRCARAVRTLRHPRQREILVRSLAGEERETIIASMAITETQYRLGKSRALASCREAYVRA